MVVSIKVKGLAAAGLFLKRKDKESLTLANNAVQKAGFFIEGEVKQSIAGHRAEPRSVDTGRFLNSINMTQPAPLTAVISTPLDYPKILEFGGVNRRPRRHFKNTAIRNTIKIKNFIESEIKKI